jgi:hypothetical protein
MSLTLFLVENLERFDELVSDALHDAHARLLLVLHAAQVERHRPELLGHLSTWNTIKVLVSTVKKNSESNVLWIGPGPTFNFDADPDPDPTPKFY